MADLDAKDVLKMVEKIIESNKEQNQALRQEFATAIDKIVHPEPTAAEKEVRERNMRERIELARMQEEAKRLTRARCPHKRVGAQFGLHNGTSVIAWKETNPTSKGPDGRSIDGPTIMIGVCQWCQSEFKPGDPDYYEKLSWGTSLVDGVFHMNVVTGNWQ